MAGQVKPKPCQLSTRAGKGLTRLGVVPRTGCLLSEAITGDARGGKQQTRERDQCMSTEQTAPGHLPAHIQYTPEPIPSLAQT